MPSIARFRGLVIYIYYEPDSPHHLPHFHVRYNDYRASFSIDPPNLLAGAFPRRQLRLVLAWAEIHQDEIIENWHLIQAGGQPNRIEGIWVMAHELYDVINFEIVDDYTLRVEFDDGSEQVIDFEPILYGQVFGALRDLQVFNQVSLDPEARTLVWPNGADFDPETLRNWPQYKDSLVKKTRQWAQIQA